MYELLHSKLTSVEGCYQQSIDITNDIFNALKYEKIKSLPSLNSQQLDLMVRIKEEKVVLRDFVKQTAMEKGMDDHKIQSLLPFVIGIEKEKLLDKIKNIVIKENELQCALYRNELYLAAMMDFSESIIDGAVAINQNENKESQLFLDQKF